MQTREKILGIVFLLGLLAWQGWPMFYRNIFGPLDELRSTRSALKSEYERKEDRQLALLRMTKELKDLKGRSLPPEPLDAQRLYQQWLTDLAQSKGFKQLKVTPENRISRGTVYVAVQVSISGQATTEELTDFLVSFYRVGLLQRIARLELGGSGRTSSSPLIVTLLAEGVCLTDTPDRVALFPQTTLVSEVDTESKQLNLASTDLLPDELPALIQIAEERLDVISAEGSVVEVTRGVDGTEPSAHAAETAVQILPAGSIDAEAAIMAARDIREAHPFALPTVFDPRFRVTGKVAVLRTDDEWSLDVSLSGDDPSLPEPDYSLEFPGASQPAGLSIGESGVLRWTGRTEVDPGRYEVEIIALRAGEEPLRNRLSVELTDPPPAAPQGDPARDIILVGVVDRDGTREAWFLNRKSGQRLRLKSSEELPVGSEKWTVVDVRAREVDLALDQTKRSIRLGQSLAEANSQ
ncbi:hypothetical protein [Stratiformator vulcanicus]|uniref:Uncharacterized protein n=1 Tax=Stratiformator vulcanicus TaxID=2527980 RepID=A0A517R245_9PLAN|nr:hypothetical protein [Stratiformator vulcanicus]QDT37950.1 hypothetical protein Pan189_23330 [Stratiformator vulcanicus]